MADVNVSLGLDSRQFDIGMKTAQNSVAGLENSFGKLGNVVSNFQRQLAGLAITGFAVNTLKGAKALDDFSKSSGIALVSLIKFTKAMQASGANQDQAIDAIGQFNAKLREASNGSEEAQKAFAAIGISLDDLRKLSGEALLAKAFDGLSKTNDDVTRLGQQMSLFGESFRIVDTSATGVTAKINQFSSEAQRSAEATKAGAEAYRSFQSALEVLKDTVLILIKPFSDLMASLKLNTDIVAGVLQMVAAFFALKKIIIPLTEAFYTFAAGTLTAGGAGLKFSGILGVMLAPVRMLGAYMAQTNTQLLISFSIWTAQGVPAASKLAISLGALAAAASRLAIAAVAIIALNDAIKGLTGVDIIDSLANKLYNLSNEYFPNATAAIDDFGKKLGMATMEETRQAKAAEESSEANRENATSNREVKDALTEKIKALHQSVSAYRAAGQAALQAFKNETDLIGATRDQIISAQERIRIEDTYIAKKRELTNQLKEAQSIEEKSAISGALKSLNQQREYELGLLDQLVEKRIKAENANQLSIFGMTQMTDAQRKLNALYSETTSIFLPELEQRLKAIKDAQTDAALAAIQEEEARRGSALTTAEYSQYLEKAAKLTNELTEAEIKLYEVQKQKRLIDFGTKERTEQEKELRDVLYDMSTITMSEQEKAYANIARDAEERARAEIASENARRGIAMSAEEESKYYAAATANVKKLTDATKANYELSRKWSTGWKKAFNDYVDEATNAAKKAESFFKKSMQGMEDLIVDFVKTGKFQWKDFVSSMLEELLRAQIQQTFANIGTAIGDMSGGGVLDSIGSLLFGSGQNAGGTKGQSANNPLYVMDVNGGGSPLGSSPSSVFATPSYAPQQSSNSGMLGSIFGGIGDLFSTTAGTYGTNYGSQQTSMLAAQDADFGGGGLWDSVANAAGSLWDSFSGWFADGGTIGAGKWGIAGEAGPEIISGPATVTPMGAGGTNSTNVTYNIVANDARSFKEMIAADPSFIHAIAMQGSKSVPGRR